MKILERLARASQVGMLGWPHAPIPALQTRGPRNRIHDRREKYRFSSTVTLILAEIARTARR
ncbi:hypothetical protein X805_21620 [Sphaerotilus natans subsp. natans DSM 6575]|uniref:Uncharacterized protein n=1 Tax=Sphaerotilus natans subsp. natans DSM 6575 TaxID=1286631 RepID=A0A059KM10_9BURK|nr:hypothetical protein X805_21620 [Sphaerotilus natans subsp. natans DSM 6575]